MRGRKVRFEAFEVTLSRLCAISHPLHGLRLPLMWVRGVHLGSTCHPGSSPLSGFFTKSICSHSFSARGSGFPGWDVAGAMVPLTTGLSPRLPLAETRSPPSVPVQLPLGCLPALPRAMAAVLAIWCLPESESCPLPQHTPRKMPLFLGRLHVGSCPGRRGQGGLVPPS